MATIENFCYSPLSSFLDGRTPQSSFSFWNDSSFDICIVYLAFLIPAHALFAVLNSYFTGAFAVRGGKWGIKRKKIPGIVVVRLVVALLLLLSPVTELVSFVWLKGAHHCLSQIMYLVLATLSWLTHVIYLLNISRSIRFMGRGPLLLNLSWYLTFMSVVLLFWQQMQYTGAPGGVFEFELFYFTTMPRSFAIATFSLQILYCLCLIFAAPDALSISDLDIPQTQFLDGSTQQRVHSNLGDDSEKQFLLQSANGLSSALSEPTVESYGSISVRKLNKKTKKKLHVVSEDKANIFSKLTFWWFQPLMSKGARGDLNDIKDLPLLPTVLSTAFVRENFRESWQKTVFKRSAVLEASGLNTENGLHSESSDTEKSRDATAAPVTGSSSEADSKREVKKIRWKDMTLFWSLNRAFGCQFYSLGLLKLLVNALSFTGPILLQYLVNFMEEKKEPIQNGYGYAIGMVCGVFLNAFLGTHYSFLISKVGLKFRAATVTLLYHKALSVNLATLAQFSTGEITNFMSVDANRIVNYANSFHEFWSLPIQIVVALVLLYLQVGLSFLGGVLVAILLIPVNRWLAKKIGKLTEDMMAHKDSRVKTITEMLFGIRVIKFCAWENVFSRKINQYREKELNSLKYRKFLDAGCVYFWATTPIIISIVTFTTYSLLGYHLTAAKVFTSLSLFSILLGPLNAYPWVINGMVEAWVSLKRVQRFLDLRETNLLEYYQPHPSDHARSLSPDHAPQIEVVAGNFSWQRGQNRSPPKSENGICKESTATGEGITATGEGITATGEGVTATGEGITATGEGITATGDCDNNKATSPFRLNDISLVARPGQLVGVIGKVGSGKSSLLAALTSEINKLDGTVFMGCQDEGVSLVTQSSWIQHATLRDNILFGREYDGDLYQTVLHACALEPDLRILPAGDLTEVGENGVTLSGGQKMRVALARAIYQNKPVYLLDDPFAAVDAHVATHLFKYVICGLLRNKTRILCTHHMRFLKSADWVVEMDGGRIANAGPPSIVLPRAEKKYSLEDLQTEKEEKVQDKAEIEPVAGSPSSTLAAEDKSVLVEEERREVDTINPRVYWSYFKSIGVVLAPTIGVFLFLMEASKDVTNWWLAYWVSTFRYATPLPANATAFNATTLFASGLSPAPVVGDVMLKNMATVSPGHAMPSVNITPSASNLYFYVGIYLGLAIGNSVFALFRAFLFAYGGLCAARALHIRLLKSVLRAPIVFFDTNPIGRIINRFSSDVFTIDDSLPFQLNIFLAQIFGLCGALVTVCYGLPWIALLLIPLAMLYYTVQGYYRWTSRELKRLSSVTLSPIYAHFTETLTGLEVIRAFRESQRFVSENETRLETNQRAMYGSNAASYWLSLRLQLIGVVVITAVALIAVLEHQVNVVNPGLVGLAISYSLSINGFISQVVVSLSETEKEMVSVERAVQYISTTPVEREGGTQEVPSTWPHKGLVELSKVVLVYRPGLLPALREVTVTFRAGEKIGVVGRTGAGKSSLFQALFRVVELVSGSIFVDGVDISKVSLTQLRSSMAIIPQDPFLFTGSVRYNIDPLGQCSDAELWSALEHSLLTGPIEALGGLDGQLEEQGKQLSAGQRQLLCLARALVSHAKVICIDEATASIDMETDELIQNTIKSEFANSTVITIAHRIDTIVSCDRILVMDRGRVQEYDTPHKLLRNHHSLFYSLYTESKRQ